MLVYHFTKAETALAIIEFRHLRLSRIANLNDPFEFLAAELSNPDRRVALKKMKKEMNATKGVVSFSKSWQNPVQWAHYAESHRGVCLGFDVPPSNLARVKYREGRLLWPDGPVSHEFMEDILLTKYAHWAYEKERRLHCELTDRSPDGHYYVNYDESGLPLRRVIVGDQSKLARADIARALGENAKDVEVFKARASFKRYRVVRQKKESLWK